jgi:ADP-ribosylation factor 2-binding protein
MAGTLEMAPREVDLLGGFGEEEDVVDGFDEDGGELGGEEGGEEVLASSSAASHSAFDAAILELEQVMMEPEFNHKVGAFIAAHCGEFDDSDENKLCYTAIFEQYVTMLEAHIGAELSSRLPNFDMAGFCGTLMERGPATVAEGLDLELLGGFGDFAAFRQMMLAGKQGMQCDAGAGGPLCLAGAPLQVHAEEQEDGVPLPDLNLSICSAISPARRAA